MLTKIQKEKLDILVQKAYETDKQSFDELDFESKSVDVAMKIFKKIKLLETGFPNVDRTKELESAKNDLKEIFGVDTKDMTKNQIYMLHQSKLANTIYYYYVLGN